jgi:hypothetical protein
MAESLEELLQLPPKGYFMTIHVAGEVNNFTNLSFSKLQITLKNRVYILCCVIVCEFFLTQILYIFYLFVLKC